MARKGKSSRKSSAARRRTRTVTPAKAVAQTVVAEPEAAPQQSFAEEYHYVINDLKRFAILAVAMFATLVVLALILG